MSTFKNASTVKLLIRKELIKRKMEAADKALAYLFGKLLTYFPTEDGHAHEAWITAVEKLKGKFTITDRVVDHHSGKRSNDPTAKKYGHASVKDSQKRLSVVIQNKLPFVRKMEYGLPITVGDESGNQGKKINPVKRPQEKGPLYGRRGPGSEGLLVFQQGGRLIKTKVRIPNETGFVDRAIKETVQFFKSKGYKVRRK